MPIFYTIMRLTFGRTRTCTVLSSERTKPLRKGRAKRQVTKFMAALTPRAFPCPWDNAIQERRSTRSKKEKERKEFRIFGNSSESESESFALNVFLHVFHNREINTEPFVFGSKPCLLEFSKGGRAPNVVFALHGFLKICTKT